MEEIFIKAKKASKDCAILSDTKRQEVLLAVAEEIDSKIDCLLEANKKDLSRMDPSNPLYDRLQLTEKRLHGIASDMRKVASLASPLDRILEERTLPNGLQLKKVSVPFGVIGMIYEARPNVTFDVFSLCFKSGNACVLKGGKDADESNKAAVELIHKVLSDSGIDPNVVSLLPATHEATAQMLGAVGYVDLVIPRGGKRLIEFVRDNAKVPCIETGAGVVNTYIDRSADLKIAKDIVFNAKTRRVSVCNALDCMIINSDRLNDLESICTDLASKDVEIIADERSYNVLNGRYPFLSKAQDDTFGTEFMSYRMAIKTVDSIQEALDHIDKYGSGHSESIVTNDEEAAKLFQMNVDAACVYVNAPTSFTDGGEFGLGAEIGISTQKLGARGPMGLSEITSYKWLIFGNGQTRP